MRPLLRPGMVVLDVGANIGYYSLLAAARVGPTGQVIAFEPGAANTALIQKSAQANGFSNIAVWPKGVDTELFHPDRRDALPHSGPVFLYVGRVAVEKNIEAFLRLELPGASRTLEVTP